MLAFELVGVFVISTSILNLQVYSVMKMSDAIIFLHKKTKTKTHVLWIVKKKSLFFFGSGVDSYSGRYLSMCLTLSMWTVELIRILLTYTENFDFFVGKNKTYSVFQQKSTFFTGNRHTVSPKTQFPIKHFRPTLISQARWCQGNNPHAQNQTCAPSTFPNQRL